MLLLPWKGLVGAKYKWVAVRKYRFKKTVDRDTHSRATISIVIAADADGAALGGSSLTGGSACFGRRAAVRRAR